MYNKNVNFPSRFVVQPSIALQHNSAWQVLYFLSRLFASAIAALLTLSRIASSAAFITPAMLTYKTVTSYNDQEMLFQRQSVMY
jgi:hypothetical protein